MANSRFQLIFAVGVLLFTSCGTMAQPVPQPVTDQGATAGTGTQTCAYPLVALQTGQDASCGGGQVHYWPVGMSAGDCHGWQAADNSGRLHSNSANNILCNDDGSFSFTQFAGNLNCQGSGVTKTFYVNVCTQDIPPVLYTTAIDLTCCSAPGSANCTIGIPSTGQGAEIFLNGQPCTP